MSDLDRLADDYNAVRRERDEARSNLDFLIRSSRAEVERMRERIATQEDGLRHGEQVARRDREHEALLETAQKALEHVEAERDEARAELEGAKQMARGWEEVYRTEHGLRRELESALAEAVRERDALKERIARMMESISMACEEPPTNCECAGCSYAREKGGDV